VDGVEYHEVWERLPESRGACWALRLTAAGDGTGGADASAPPPRRAFLMVAGDCFMFVADRVAEAPPLPRVAAADDGASLPASERLAAALAALPSLAEQRLALSFESSYGRVAAREGRPAWRIELSTLPGRAGATLLPPSMPSGGADELLASLRAAPDGTLRAGAFPPPGGWHAERDA
jgi:hypothetical protein